MIEQLISNCIVPNKSECQYGINRIHYTNIHEKNSVYKQSKELHKLLETDDLDLYYGHIPTFVETIDVVNRQINSIKKEYRDKLLNYDIWVDDKAVWSEDFFKN